MNNEEKILEMLGSISEQLANQDRRLGTLESGMEELRDYTRQTRVLLEQQDHNIRLIAEQYTDIAEKLDKANDRAAQLDDMRDRLRTLENVVMNHSAILRGLAKAE